MSEETPQSSEQMNANEEQAIDWEKESAAAYKEFTHQIEDPHHLNLQNAFIRTTKALIKLNGPKSEKQLQTLYGITNSLQDKDTPKPDEEMHFSTELLMAEYNLNQALMYQQIMLMATQASEIIKDEKAAARYGRIAKTFRFLLDNPPRTGIKGLIGDVTPLIQTLDKQDGE